MRSIRKFSEIKIADDPAFYLIEEKLDEIIDTIGVEAHFGENCREAVWQWICTYATERSWHPFEFIAWWVRQYSLNGDLCRLVGWY